jgi:hypothetical protein
MIMTFGVDKFTNIIHLLALYLWVFISITSYVMLARSETAVNIVNVPNPPII